MGRIVSGVNARISKPKSGAALFTLLALIFVLLLDIGGAGTILALGVAESYGAHIHILGSAAP